jgi:hypothetical protein
MAYILLSLVFSAIASYLVSIGNTPLTFYLKVAGWGFAATALALAGMAIATGIKIMGFGQTMLGMIYTIGGGLALANAALSFAGNASFNGAMLWMGAIAAILTLLGSMASSPVATTPEDPSGTETRAPHQHQHTG